MYRKPLFSLTILLSLSSLAWAQPVKQTKSSDSEGQHSEARAAAERVKKFQEKQKASGTQKQSNPSTSGAGKSAKSTSKSETLRPELEARWDAPQIRAPKMGFPWVEHHGYFRTRADLFYDFDLGTYDAQSRTGTSSFLPPLTEVDLTGNLHPEGENHRFAQGSSSLASANLRLRYQPTVHVSETMRIHTTVDVLDNLVMGSTSIGGPHTQRNLGEQADRFGLPDPAVALFEDAQRPPESGTTSYRDGMRVKHAWGEWTTPLGVLAFGRMPNHWGLGLLANAGQCMDCDFGDSVDRLMATTLLLDTYLSIGWDFAHEGASGFSGQQTYANQGLGQPYDLEQRDDVSQYTIAIFRRPVSAKEQEARRRRLHTDRKVGFDWGVSNVIRTQTLESTFNPSTNVPQSAEQYQLFEVDGFTYTPDVWLEINYVPSTVQHVRLQVEALGVFGELKEVPQNFSLPNQICVDGADPDETDCELINPRRRDIERLGYAVELDVRHGDFGYGLHHGFASGDENSGFGYLSGSEISNADAAFRNPDRALTSFRFDRDYQVDHILFREILGGVTNAWYLKPYGEYKFIKTTDEEWGVIASAMYAHAHKASATPGRENPLGLEFDLQLYIREFDRLNINVVYGHFFPFSAFNRLDDNGDIVATPESAITLQGMIGLEF